MSDTPGMGDVFSEEVAEEMTEPVEKAAEGASEGSKGGGVASNSLVQGLLSTEPHTRAEDPIGVILRGVKKFINGATDVGMTAGQTAAEDFTIGTIALLNQGQGQDQGQDDRDVEQADDGLGQDDDAVSGDELAANAAEGPL